MKFFKFLDKEYVYDGEMKSINITGELPPLVSVQEYLNNAQIEVGSYEVKVNFSVSDPANYNIPESMTAILKISSKTKLSEIKDSTLFISYKKKYQYFL